MSESLDDALVILAIMLTFLLLPFFLIFDHLMVPAYLRFQNRV